MKIINTKHYFIVIAFITFVINSCDKDRLIEYPRGYYHEGNFTDTTTIPYNILAEAYVQDTYAQLRGWDGISWSYVLMSSTTSDDADKGSTTSDGGSDVISLSNYTFIPTNWVINNVYQGCYSGISKSNMALDFIRLMPDSLSLDRDRLSAEAKFLRAYNYFRLAQLFGGVSLIDKVIGPEDPITPRSSFQETLQFVENDLIEASTFLPTKVSLTGANIGRASSEAAKGLLAKVYLYQKNYGAVISQTSSIISSGSVNLSTPFNQIFTEIKENGPESLFEVQSYMGIDIDGGSSQYAETQGVRSGPLDLGWGFNIPSQSLIDAFETGDPRKKYTVLYRGEAAPDGIVIPSTSENKYYNAKVYQWDNERNIKGRASMHPFGGWINARILRYSDVLLMHAEASNELGDYDEALEKLEMVRARARGSNNDVLPEITTTNYNELKAAIQHERRIELAMEFERYFDLIRWNLATSILGPKGWTAGKNEVFPIPQSVIDNSDGIIIQNPGY